MALPVKYKQTYVPDVREVKDGQWDYLSFLIILFFVYIFSFIGRVEKELHGCIRRRCHVSRPHSGTVAFSGTR